MKFVIKRLPKKKSDPKWKIQLRSYKKEDIKKYAKDGHTSRTVEFDLKKEGWERYGFLFNMSVEQARERAKQLNAIEKLEDEKKARLANYKRLEKIELKESAFIPKILEIEFKEKLFDESDCMSEEEFSRTKIISHWRACRQTIMALETKLDDWEDKKLVFYKYFRKKKWSVSYVEKLISLLNRWGKFCAKKQRAYFTELPFPKHRHKEKIADTYFESVSRTKESAPLRVKDLEEAKDKLDEKQYRWLYVSLWFGLRPKEIDSLIGGEERTWRVTTQSGCKILHVYQSKLTGVPKEQRWKKIPVLFDEQKTALKFIKKQELKRPLVKTIKRHLGEFYTTYAGRKGLEALLREKKIPFEAISTYLGHKNVDRTWRNYRDTDRVMIPEIDSNGNAA